MVEYGAGTMEEAQIFHAPSHRYSVGGGYLKLDSDVDGRERSIAYARANLLVKRWNLEAAQANVFAWGGAGSASGNDFGGNVFTGTAGAQADYETRRVYASLKADFYDSSEFTHRIDTCSSVSPLTSTNTTRWLSGWSSRDAPTRVICTAAPNGLPWCGSSRAVYGWRPA